MKKLIVIVVLLLLVVGVAWAATDWGYVGRCTYEGNAYPLCVRWCSY